MKNARYPQCQTCAIFPCQKDMWGCLARHEHEARPGCRVVRAGCSECLLVFEERRHEPAVPDLYDVPLLR